MLQRRFCPVFVIGCPRSGTNLMYDTLLSAGEFAVYRGRLLVYQVLIPRFGRIDQIENRRKMMAFWVRSKGFRRSGLDGAELTAKVLQTCRSGGDFISTVMGEVARVQHANRWAVYDPVALLRVDTLKREIPEALFVHIIRDGRDVAVSLRKLGDFCPFPWSRRPGSLEETALYWQWIIEKGRRFGRQIPNDYIEIRYEELVLNPRETLTALGAFLEHNLNYDRIKSVSLGSLARPNSSFLDESPYDALNPVERWRQRLSRDQIGSIEWHVGKTLEAVGYGISDSRSAPGVRDKLLRALYPFFLDTKLWLKFNTPLGRFASLSKLELLPEGAPDSSCSSPNS